MYQVLECAEGDDVFRCRFRHPCLVWSERRVSILWCREMLCVCHAFRVSAVLLVRLRVGLAERSVVLAMPCGHPVAFIW